ncbi:MAG: hypothetical protein ACRCTM_17925 [Sphaerotilus sulfidivorans]
MRNGVMRPPRAILAELPPEARRRCLERVGVLVEGMGLDDDEDAAAAHWFAGMLPESSRGAEG